MIAHDLRLIAAYRRAYQQHSITALIAVHAYEQAQRHDVYFPHRPGSDDATTLLAVEARKRATQSDCNYRDAARDAD